MPGEDDYALIQCVRPCPAIGAVAFVGFVRGTDLYIGEAQYTDLEYPAKVGCGHASLSATVVVALQGASRRSPSSTTIPCTLTTW